MSDAVDPANVDVPTLSAPAGTAETLMGPAACGYSVQMLLFGVFFALFCTAVQSGELRTHSRPARAAMWCSLFLNVVYTGVVFYQNYDASVSQDRTYAYLSLGNLTYNALPMLNAIISSLTEGFLAAKAGTLIRSRVCRNVFWIWIGCLIALVLAASAIATADGVFYYFGADEQSLPLDYNSAAAVWLYGSAVADLSISIACATSLNSRIAGFNKTTDSLLRRLIWISVRTASYTTTLSIVGAITMSIWGDYDNLSYITIGLWLPMPALYGLSLFTFWFGSRRAIASQLGEPSERTPPRGGGIYVRRSVRAFDSKGASIDLPVHPDEQELSRLPRAVVHVQQHSIVEYDEPDLEAAVRGLASGSRHGIGASNLGREWRGEKSWEKPRF